MTVVAPASGPPGSPPKYVGPKRAILENIGFFMRHQEEENGSII